MNLHSTSPYTRPSKGTATERVWELADQITRRHGRPARRAEVIAAYVAEGGNRNTASTQYAYWSQKYREESKANAPTSSSREMLPVQLRIDAGGRLVIPAEIRAAMELGEDGKVTARVVDGELSLITPAVALRKIQEIVRRHIPEGIRLVDEFIAEKRREAELE